MKRDWDLIRKILTDIEEDRDVFADMPVEPKWADQSSEEYELQLSEYTDSEKRIAGHLEMLIENGYLKGLKITRTGCGRFGYSVSDPRLTMTGHDLLDTMRSPKVWEAIKSTAKKKGIELTFDAIKTLGGVVLKQILG